MSNSTNLGIPLVATNQASPEIVVNAAVNALDQAGNSSVSIATADADVTLTAAQFTSNLYFTFTGTDTADRNVIVPATKRLFVLSNATTGGFKLTAKTAGGTGIGVHSADGSIILYSDGTNVVSLGIASGSLALIADTDVLITTPANADVLTWETSSSKWKNKPATNAVTSVLGRTGAVVAATNDYSEAQISFTDITTNNVSITKHGLAPKAPNDATKFLDGTGVYSVPAGGGGSSTLAADTDVSISAPTNAQVLTYNTATSKWINAAAAGGGGGSPSRTTASISQSIVAGAVYQSTVSLAKSFALLKLTVNVPSRLRLYCTSGGRDADAGRPPETPLSTSTQNQCICDMVLNSMTGLSWIFAPFIGGSDGAGSATGSIAFNLTNLSGVTQTVTATLGYLPMES
jgi:hypothetical protein